MKVNPKTQAVIDAFLDLDTPETIKVTRRAELREHRPKLYAALEGLVRAVMPEALPPEQPKVEPEPPHETSEERAEREFNEL